MKDGNEVSRTIAVYADMVRRICFLHLKNEADTEDVFQTVFLKYALNEGKFENVEHEKAWLIRVAVNACKDILKSYYRKNAVSIDEIIEETAPETENRGVLEAVLSLPQKYKDPIYLHYYEGYNAAEISSILGTNESTIYTRLSRGRALLKEKLGDEEL
jgi:RNA polymerase sigma-70 factor (ECF subfamily)